MGAEDLMLENSTHTTDSACRVYEADVILILKALYYKT